MVIGYIIELVCGVCGQNIFKSFLELIMSRGGYSWGGGAGGGTFPPMNLEFFVPIFRIASQ